MASLLSFIQARWSWARGEGSTVWVKKGLTDGRLAWGETLGQQDVKAWHLNNRHS